LKGAHSLGDIPKESLILSKFVRPGAHYLS
jgi:hypothetical protein